MVKRLFTIYKETQNLGLALREDSLVGQFIVNAPRTQLIQGVVNRLWGSRGSVEVIELGSGGFIFKFANKLTKSWVLEGPWYVVNKPLLL